MAEYKGGVGDGNRVRRLLQQREKAQKELNNLKQQIQHDNQASLKLIDQSFSSTTDMFDEQFKKQTIGSVLI